MSANLLSLPAELRSRIWELTLCTQGALSLDRRDYKSLRRSPDYELPPQIAAYPPSESTDDRADANAHALDSVGRRDTLGSDGVAFHHYTGQGDENGRVVVEQLRIQDNGSNLQFRLGSNVAEGRRDDAADDVVVASVNTADAYERYAKGNSFHLVSSGELSLGILQVNRQIHQEATPIFFANANFVPQTDPISAMRFFLQLRPQDMRNITTITITGAMLFGDDFPSRASWSTQKIPSIENTPALQTFFGAFLATQLPKLSDVYLYTPPQRYADFYCGYALVDLESMLCGGRIKRLHYVFMSGHGDTEGALTSGDSNTCMARLIGTPGESIAEHECYQMQGPFSREQGWDALDERHARRRAYKKRHAKLLKWKWSDRDVFMGHGGPVQAVITAWLASSGEK